MQNKYKLLFFSCLCFGVIGDVYGIQNLDCSLIIVSTVMLLLAVFAFLLAFHNNAARKLDEDQPSVKWKCGTSAMIKQSQQKELLRHQRTSLTHGNTISAQELEDCDFEDIECMPNHNIYNRKWNRMR